jgi:hypothetical protein
MSPAEITAIVSGAVFTAGTHLLFRIPISRSLLITAVVPAAVLLFQGVGDVVEQQKIYARHFDRQQWLTASGPQSSIRREMIGDLLDGKHVVGMSREDVIELLGTPEEEFSSNKCISYQVSKQNRGVIEDCLYFSLELDGDKVQDWRVWQN